MLVMLCLFLALVPVTEARTTSMGGYTWEVRAGLGGPGPNAWDERNVWLDDTGNLHLKIALRDGRWSCAEVTMQKRLGFGTYQFQVSGPIDRLDPNVVLGLFNYPTGDVGPDGTHEIDIEFAHWGDASNPIGNYTAWPVDSSLRQVSHPFVFRLTGHQTTQRFRWHRTGVLFQSLRGYRDDDGAEYARWKYTPPDFSRYVSTSAMPVHLNLWLFKGHPPADQQEVEVTIHGFKFTPVKVPVPVDSFSRP